MFIWFMGRSIWTALHGPGPWETPAGDYTIIRPMPTAVDWLKMAAGSAVYAVISSLVALIIWRIAYRRVDETPSPQPSSP